LRVYGTQAAVLMKVVYWLVKAIAELDGFLLEGSFKKLTGFSLLILVDTCDD
jgi:hypothetical protein